MGATLSREEDTIELLTDGLSSVVRPKQLIFEGIDSDFELNYFRLETGELKPIVIDDNFPIELCFEVLKENYQNYVEGDYPANFSLPQAESDNRIKRFFKGAFVIFKKTSIYNQNHSTYDGRHEKWGDKKFKNHVLAINKLLEKYRPAIN